MAKKQYVWLVRYGKTEFALKEFDGPYNSDIDPNEGVHHAQCIANKIASSTEKTNSQTQPNVKIYTSPFLRCVHTASIIGTKLNTKIKIEDGLYEWLVPSLLIERETNIRTYPNTITELQSLFPETIEIEMNDGNKSSSLNPYLVDESNDLFSFPETNEEKLLQRCNNTLQLILNDHNDDDGDDENIIIVAHAPCVQSLAFAMEEGVEDVKDSKLSKWPLGGITRFSRGVHSSIDDKGGINKVGYGKWNMDFYGVTDHMPGDYKNGVGLWSLSCFNK